MPAAPSITQHTLDYECAEYINRLIFWAHILTRKTEPIWLVKRAHGNTSKINLARFNRAQEVQREERFSSDKKKMSRGNKTRTTTTTQERGREKKKKILVINVRSLQPCWPLSAKQNQQRTSKTPTQKSIPCVPPLPLVWLMHDAR